MSRDFNSLAPCGANRSQVCALCAYPKFQLTRPVWGEPVEGSFVFRRSVNFNSLAPCGANLISIGLPSQISEFQLTRPVWGEPGVTIKEMKAIFISTHSPRVGRTMESQTDKTTIAHFNSLAPCGANPQYMAMNEYDVNFNSLAPCGANRRASTTSISFGTFQLTRPVWGEPEPDMLTAPVNVISTHSPRVGRTARLYSYAPHSVHFNSLAPCGANRYPRRTRRSYIAFQLTRPVWGEPRVNMTMVSDPYISTHSPRVGRTAAQGKPQAYQGHFNSLAPCGANPPVSRTGSSRGYFNSLAPCGANRTKLTGEPLPSSFQLTRPVWGEPSAKAVDGGGRYISTHSPRVGRTPRRFGCRMKTQISTHSPRVGRTTKRPISARSPANFNSLAPCGANHDDDSKCDRCKHFNSLAPCGANLRDSRRCRLSIDFNSLAPCGANQCRQSDVQRHGRFQLTRPVWGEPLRSEYNNIRLFISTHSPRVGRTDYQNRKRRIASYFNSLAPCGANLGA